MSDSSLPGEPAADDGDAAGLDPHHPRHRREGVPLDGAPDLGLFAAPAPITAEPVNPAAWAGQSTQYVAPSPVPPALPVPPRVSEFQPASPPPIDPAEFAPPRASDPEQDFAEFGEDPDTETTG